MASRSTFVLFAAVLVVAGVAGGGIAASMVDSSGASDASGGGAGPAAAPALQQPAGDEYESLYDETIGSVVTVQVATDRGTGQGSGFLIDDSHVVTNEHVVAREGSVRVRFANDTWSEATVVGTDPYTDLAVLEVQNVPDEAEPLSLASAPAEEGQPVAALGSPFGLEGTITTGVVSGVNRSMPTESGFTIPATVQTDAAINPGNSGGPLLTTNGTVLGVNRAKRGDNVGYAISAPVVQRVVPALIEDGDYEHSYVGIRSVPVTPTVAEVNGLETATGVHVVDVVGDGPAAGVLQGATGQTTVDGRSVRTGGDVILAVEDQQVASHQQLSRVLLLETQPGEAVTFTILRDGEEMTVDVTLGERPPLTNVTPGA